MKITIPIPINPKWVFLISFFFFSPSLSDPKTTESGLFCDSSEKNTNPNFIPNFITAMRELSKRMNQEQWGALGVISPEPQVYTYAQCYGILSHHECLACYSESRKKLPKCLPDKSARIYLDGCFLRYDNYSFFYEVLDKEHDTVRCSSPDDYYKDTYLSWEFAKKVDRVIINVTRAAVSGNGFAVTGERGGVEAVYVIAQCWITMDPISCKACLLNAGSKVRKCVPAREGRVMNAGCYLRYSTEKFFTNDPVSAVELSSPKVGIIIGGILSAIALFVLAFFGALFGYKRISQWKKAQNTPAGTSSSVHNSNLNYNYEVLEKATDFFDGSRKLGQGGAGSVFKGTLPDGRTVAVKRLFFNTRQWVDQFFNEVNLISGIQHKNVVRLLGCSIEGPESLLVYEYVPNRSLDQILFVKNSVHILGWQERFDIISGTAEGLAYLHRGCGEKIIHRDIKTSNILLDENFTPKIADFGLARGVASDKSHISTGIAGTLGYMAPEYLVRGQLTEKADVYAFGVLVLEIVCGRKNSVFTNRSTSVLHSVWKHYKANNITESVDHTLKDRYPIREASNVLQIGLLCTQASVALRPSMDEVVQMLTNEEFVIPSPKQPPFLNASVLTDDTTRTSCMSTLTSNWQTIMGLSCSYTDKKSSNWHLSIEVSSFRTAKSSIMGSLGSSSPSTSEATEPRWINQKFSKASESEM